MEKNLDRMVSLAKDFVVNVLRPRSETIMSEVAIAINWQTEHVVILEGVSGRQYPSMPGYQFGTADLVCILKTGELLVADWKTGGTAGAQEQLLSLACGLSRLFDNHGVIISCLSVDDDGVWPNERPVRDEELESHWFAMQMAWEGIPDDVSEHTTGIHCSQLYCPHLAYCSAVTGLVQDYGLEDESKQERPLLAPERLLKRFRMTDDPGGDEEAGAVMARITAAKRQIKYWEAKIKGYVEKGGRCVTDSYEWKERGGAGYRWGKR